jgi:hypothetical protein
MAMQIEPYRPAPLGYRPKYINTSGLPPKYSPTLITPAVDEYFNLLKGLKRRMNPKAAQLQANINYNLKDWITQEESSGIDLTEWLSKQGYNRSISRTRKQRKQRKQKKSRRV